MRTIKFRAWLRNVGIMLNVYKLDQTGDAGKGTHFETSKGYSEHGAQFVFNIDDAELMQFTGLKDKNGKEIYEGDVVRYLDGKLTSTENGMEADEFYSVGRVYFCEEEHAWDFSNRVDTERYDALNDMSEIEVIGNIYENPELLTSEQTKEQ